VEGISTRSSPFIEFSTVTITSQMGESNVGCPEDFWGG
jgi:hypothetical protein